MLPRPIQHHHQHIDNHSSNLDTQSPATTSNTYADAAVYPMSAMVIFLVFSVLLILVFYNISRWDSPFHIDIARFGKKLMMVGRRKTELPVTSIIPTSGSAVGSSPSSSVIPDKSQLQDLMVLTIAATAKGIRSKSEIPSNSCIATSSIVPMTSKSQLGSSGMSVHNFLKRT